MYSSNDVVPMRPKGSALKEDRRAFRQTTNARQELVEGAETAKVMSRLLAVLYRKEGGRLVIPLSEFTLYRMAEGMHVTGRERHTELRRLVLVLLDGHGIVNHRVVRRQADRLRIIGEILDESVEIDDIETIASRRQMTYRLSTRQMKLQARAYKQHSQRLRTRRKGQQGRKGHSSTSAAS